MRDKKLLRKTIKLLSISREELEHVVKCEDCLEPLGPEGFHCDEYREKFWGVPPRPDGLEPNPLNIAMQEIWGNEILRSAMPQVLRKDTNA